MGSTYTRQSTFTDGDTITADLFNTEFDQLVAAFAATSGHSHDGTAGEGGAYWWFDYSRHYVRR